ncbi:addiction module antitoxin RelB [Sphingobium cloacae]|uniref:Addiction module antitoxin RelB n=2 Tax=Sphingobium cloacae TaxID=120107 RepID=A0A1E1F5H8_9SPHN|nr:addiction module antitoxin RelB [Sphingobium cloacae]
MLTSGYTSHISDSMETQQTPAFADWFDGLRDRKAKSKIAGRIARFELGLMGDVKSVGDGVSEARIDFGPGYRLYFTRRGNRLIVLLVGGDKSTQQRDIARAKDMAAQIP